MKLSIKYEDLDSSYSANVLLCFSLSNKSKYQIQFLIVQCVAVWTNFNDFWKIYFDSTALAGVHHAKLGK